MRITQSADWSHPLHCPFLQLAGPQAKRGTTYGAYIPSWAYRLADKNAKKPWRKERFNIHNIQDRYVMFFPLLDILSCSHFVSEAWKAGMFKIAQACSSGDCLLWAPESPESPEFPTHCCHSCSVPVILTSTGLVRVILSQSSMMPANSFPQVWSFSIHKAGWLFLVPFQVFRVIMSLSATCLDI